MSYKCAHALGSGICPERVRARRMASARVEVTMQSAFQDFVYLSEPVGRRISDCASDEDFAFQA